MTVCHGLFHFHINNHIGLTISKYSYLTSIPLIAIYAVGFSIIKYSYGFTVIPGTGSEWAQWQLWRPPLTPKFQSHAHSVRALARQCTKRNPPIVPVFFSCLGTRDVSMPSRYPPRPADISAQGDTLRRFIFYALASELRLNPRPAELCFWLFLIHSSSAKQDWFRSLYFKTWAIGSVGAIICMPLVTIFTREDPYKVCRLHVWISDKFCKLWPVRGLHNLSRKSRKLVFDNMVSSGFVDIPHIPREPG
jgi:hypothetical protein